jgi:hypothetical protein
MNVNHFSWTVIKFAAAVSCLLLNLYRLYMLYPFNAVTVLDILAIISTGIAGHYLGMDALHSLKK